MDEQLKALYEYSKTYMRSTPKSMDEFPGWLVQNGGRLQSMMEAMEPGSSKAYDDIFNPKKKSTSTSPSQGGASVAKGVKPVAKAPAPVTGNSYVKPGETTQQAIYRMKGLSPEGQSMSQFTGKPISKPKTQSKASPTQVPTLQQRSDQLTKKYMNLDWVERAVKPSKYKGLEIKNEDGSVSTHKLAYAGVDGKFWVYPTIVMKDGKLVELSDDEAFQHAKNTKSYIPVNDEKLAEYYSQNGLIDHSKPEFYRENLPNIIPQEPEKTYPGADITLQKIQEAKAKETTMEGRLKATKEVLAAPKPSVYQNSLPKGIDDKLSSLTSYVSVAPYANTTEDQKPEWVKTEEQNRANRSLPGPRTEQPLPASEKPKVKTYAQFQQFALEQSERIKEGKGTLHKEVVAAQTPEYLIYDVFGDMKDPLPLWNAIAGYGKYDREIIRGMIDDYANAIGGDDAKKVYEEMNQYFGLHELDDMFARITQDPESIKLLKSKNPKEYERLKALNATLDMKIANLRMMTMEAKGSAEAGHRVLENTTTIQKNSEVLYAEGKIIEKMISDIDSKYDSDPDVKELQRLSELFKTTQDNAVLKKLKEQIQNVNSKRTNDPDVQELKQRMKKYDELVAASHQLGEQSRELSANPETEKFLDLMTDYQQAQKDVAKTKLFEIEQAYVKAQEDINKGVSLLGGLSNKTVDGAWSIAQFIPSITSSVEELIGYSKGRYTTAESLIDQFEAYKQGYAGGSQFVVKEREDFIKNGEVNMFQLASTVTEQIPMLAYFVLLGKFGGLSGAGQNAIPALGPQSIVKTIQATIAQRGFQTMAATYAITYNEKLQEALNKGYSGPAAFAYANEMTFVDGLSELMFDEYGMMEGAASGDIADYLMQLAGKKGAQKAAGRAIVKGLVGEPIEEVVAGLNEVVMTGQGKSMSEWAEIVASSAILSGALGARGAFMESQQIKNMAMFKAAQNPAMAHEFLATQMEGKALDDLMQQIYSYSAVLDQMPDGISEIKQADIATLQVENREERNRIAVANNLIEQARQDGDQVEMRKQQANLELYQKALDKRRAAIEMIYQDPEYDTKKNQELQKLAEKDEKDRPTQVEIIEAIAEQSANKEVMVAEVQAAIQKRHNKLSDQQKETMKPLVEDAANLRIKYLQLRKEHSIEQAEGKEVNPERLKLIEVMATQIQEIEYKIDKVATDPTYNPNINQQKKGEQDGQTSINVSEGVSSGAQTQTGEGNPQIDPGIPQAGQNEITPEAGVSQEAPVITEPKTKSFYHGGLNEDFNINDLDVNRLAEKQQKKGRSYAGFYLYDEEGRSGAETYSDQTGKGLHRFDIREDANVLTLNNIERVTQAQLEEYRQQGYDLIQGVDVRGRTEYILLNKDIVVNVVNEKQTPKKEEAAPAITTKEEVATEGEQKETVAPEIQRSRMVVERRGDHLLSSKAKLKKSHEQSMKHPKYAEEFQKYLDSIDELQEQEKDLPKEMQSDYKAMRERFFNKKKKAIAEQNEKIKDALRDLTDKLAGDLGAKKNIMEEEYPSYREIFTNLASAIAQKQMIYGEALWEKLLEQIKKIMPKSGKMAFTKKQLEQLKKDIIDSFPGKERIEQTIEERSKKIAQSDLTAKEIATIAKRMKLKAEEDPEFAKAYEKLKGVFEAGYNPNSMESSMAEAELFVNEVMADEAGEMALLRALETGQLHGLNASYIMYGVYKYYNDQLEDDSLEADERAEIMDKMAQASAIFMKEQILSGQTVKAYHALSRLINPDDLNIIAEKMARKAMMKEIMDKIFGETGMSVMEVSKLNEALKQFFSNKSKEQILKDLDAIADLTSDDIANAKEDMELKDIIALLRGKDKAEIKKILDALNETVQEETKENKEASILLDYVLQILSIDDVSELTSRIQGLLENQTDTPIEFQDFMNVIAQRTDMKAEELDALLKFLENKFPFAGLNKQVQKLTEAFLLADKYNKGLAKTEDKLLAGKVRNLFKNMTDEERVKTIEGLIAYIADQNMDISKIRGKKKSQRKYEGQGTWPKRKEPTRGTVEGADQLLARMQKMSASQRRKMVQKYIQVMGERDIITDDKFADIMAEVLGIPFFGDQQKQALIGLMDKQKIYNEATDNHIKAADEYMKNLAAKTGNLSLLREKMLDAQRAMFKARNKHLRAELELSMVMSGQKTWGSRLTFLIQGNLLIWATSHLRNFYANIYRIFFSTPARITSTVVDSIFAGIGLVADGVGDSIGVHLSDNTKFNRWVKATFNQRMTVNAFVGYKYWTPNFLRETGKTVRDMFSKYGISPTELSKRDAKEVMNIARAMNRVYVQPFKMLKAMAQGKPYVSPYAERMTVNNVLKDVVMATFGLPAEINFRFLGLGDKPFRSGYEAAEMATISWLLGFRGPMTELMVNTKGEYVTFMERAINDKKTPDALKDKYQKTLDEVTENIKRVWKLDDEAIEAMKSDGIGQWIRKIAEDYGAWSTYQMTNPFNPKHHFNTRKEMDVSIKSGLMKYAELLYKNIGNQKIRVGTENFMKVMFTSLIPYETTLFNIIIETAKMTSPTAMFAKGMYHLVQGDRRNAVKALGESSMGFVLRHIAFTLTSLGLIKPPDDDEEKKETQFSRTEDEMRPGSFNLDGAIRYFLRGESPVYRIGDRTRMLMFMGTPGLVMLANSYYSKKRQGMVDVFNMPDTMFDGGDLPDGMYLKAMAKTIMGTSFLQNANVALNTMMGESTGYEERAIFTSLVMTGIITPFAPATIRRALMAQNHEYQKVINDEDMWKNLSKTILYNFGRDIDAETRINAWGEKVPYMPKGASKWKYWFFSAAQPKTNMGSDKPSFIQGQGDPRLILGHLYENFHDYYGKGKDASIKPSDLLPPIVLNKFSIGDQVTAQKSSEAGEASPDVVLDDVIVTATTMKFPPKIIDEMRMEIGQRRLQKINNVLYTWHQDIFNSPDTPYEKNREYWDADLIKNMNKAYSEGRDEGLAYVMQKHGDEIIELARQKNKQMNDELDKMRGNQLETARIKTMYLNKIIDETWPLLDLSLDYPEENQ